jgi:hypothetical protein
MDNTTYITQPDQEVQEGNKVHMRIHKYYPPLPDCPVLMLSDQEKKERVKLFQNYIRYRLTNYSTAPYYDNPDDLQLMIDAYFDSIKPVTIKAKGGDFTYTPFTISGLVLFCGFCSRQSFYDMEKDNLYSVVIKSARIKIENHIEQSMQNGVSTAGNIFWLKNHGWTDRTEQTINQTIREVKVSVNQADTNDLISTI